MKKNYSRVLIGLIASTALFFSGCGNSDNFVFTNTNLVNPPVAVNDAFNALGNATLNQSAANGVLTNDTVNGATISSFDAVGSNGGAIVLNADGSFTYTPVFGFVGAETFTYTLSNASGASTATVTLTSTGRGFFVDNTAAPGGDGSQASPFDTLAAGIAAAAAGDTVFVARGDGTNTNLTGAVNLPAGVNLIGEGTGLILTQTIVAPGLAPVLTGPINCGGTNTISGVTISGSADDAIIINGVGDVTIDNNTISNWAFRGMDIDDISGTVNVTNNTFATPPDTDDDYIECDSDTSATLNINNNVFLNDEHNDVDDLCYVYFNLNAIATVSFTGNQAVGTAADDFEYGFYFELNDSAQATVTVDNNQLTNFIEEAIGVHGYNTTTLNGSIINNMIDNVSNDDGIHVELAGGGTVTVSGNMVSNIDQDGIDIESSVDSGTCIVSNNQIATTGDDGVDFDGSNAAGANIAIRDNTVTGVAQAGLDLTQSDTGTSCFEITGNNLSGDIELTENTTGAFNVEQSMQLDTLNTLNGNMVTTSGTITDRADGFCAIP